MSIEFTFVPAAGSHISGDDRDAFDRDASAASQAERAGFESVVLDGLGGVARGARLPATPGRLIVPHRAAGSPLAAARRLWDLSERSNGRIALQITGGDGETTAEGHVQSHQRTDEYLTLLKRLWSSGRPFDYEGPFYSIRNGFVPRAAAADARIPIRMSGLSGMAVKIAARHADVVELGSGNLQEARLLMERIRAAAALHGRSSRMRFALPIAVATPGEAEATGRLAVEPSAQSALQLLSYVEAGVSEFTVTAADDRDLQLFGATVAALVRNSAARRDVPQLAIDAAQANVHLLRRWQ